MCGLNETKFDNFRIFAPFWRFAIEKEWKSTWQEEWAYRASVAGEWWRVELKAFLSIVKDLSEKGISLGPLTKECIDIIKERFPKKKEVS